MEMIVMVYFPKNGLDSFSLSNHGLWLIPLTILVPLGSMKGIILLVCGSGMVNFFRSLAFLSCIWYMVFSSSNFFMLNLLELS
ncbi:hypothetical protein OV015_25865, partial [Salmonella enterica subsp. enterica serovar 1,4,[5],12:i:-]|nr:hypothetical protein [Salmonella enterica subsp. enterica serovar 1,4,[5],12:i:-]